MQNKIKYSPLKGVVAVKIDAKHEATLDDNHSSSDHRIIGMEFAIGASLDAVQSILHICDNIPNVKMANAKY